MKNPKNLKYSIRVPNPRGALLRNKDYRAQAMGSTPRLYRFLSMTRPTGLKAAGFATIVFFIFCSLSAAVWAASSRPSGDITPERLLRAETGKDDQGEWLAGGRDWRQSYYSPLSQINKRNVGKLGFAWALNIDGGASFQGNPIVVDGRMFRQILQCLRCAALGPRA